MILSVGHAPQRPVQRLNQLELVSGRGGDPGRRHDELGSPCEGLDGSASNAQLTPGHEG